VSRYRVAQWRKYEPDTTGFVKKLQSADSFRRQQPERDVTPTLYEVA
jgi:hypothetical protein